MVIKGYKLEPLSKNRCFDKHSFSAGLFGTSLEHDESCRGEGWAFMDKSHRNLTEISLHESRKLKGDAVLFRYYSGDFPVKGCCKIEDNEGCPYVLRFSFSVQVCEALSFYNAMTDLTSNPAWKNKTMSVWDIWEALELGPSYPKHLGEIGLGFNGSASFEHQFKRLGEKWLNEKLQPKGLGIVPGSLEGVMEIDEYLKKKKELEKKLEEIKK